jgi:hypothetical protein
MPQQLQLKDSAQKGRYKFSAEQRVQIKLLLLHSK